MGRPSMGDNARSVRVTVRFTPAEAERYAREAKRAGVGLSVWLQACADIVAESELNPVSVRRKPED